MKAICEWPILVCYYLLSLNYNYHTTLTLSLNSGLSLKHVEYPLCVHMRKELGHCSCFPPNVPIWFFFIIWILYFAQQTLVFRCHIFQDSQLGIMIVGNIEGKWFDIWGHLECLQGKNETGVKMLNALRELQSHTLDVSFKGLEEIGWLCSCVV